MTGHRPDSRTHGAHLGRHRKPRPSLRTLIYDRLIDRDRGRTRPAREITLSARRAERLRRQGGRDA